MRPYYALLRMSVRRLMSYRLSTVLGWIGGGAYLVASLAVWSALLAQGPIAGYDWETMKAYLLIGWATGAIGSASGDWRMADRILWGEVATDLTKPIDYQGARFAEHAGGLVVELAAIGVAVTAVAAFAGGVPLPASPAQAGLFLLSFLMVVPLKFVITYLICMLCFWTHNFMGISWAKQAVVTLFSGALVPLAMLPSWLAATAAVLPFASITATPAALYLGQVTGTQAWQLIAIQAGWVAGLWYAARFIWRGALRALTIHGG
ncbi:ABC transporter permease [Rhizocola hellebori]|uniref:ABC transporter permease n=1 Tax=Rhizocola hellebori TaxID=1392758 RepID=A0A8J3QIR8_9ACTN|nr:ABC-2 family transporter protein [Rhizocola hellebori]GIH11401.1 ABC transporter permease [Rhizocola hellebori]